MADVFDRAKRSLVMANIRSKGNRTTELALAAILRSAKISGWRRHQKVVGKPDFIFRSQRVAIFVDGCFWHGCPRCYQAPSQNSKFWRTKLNANKTRDRKVNSLLRADDWRVMRLWEHDLRHSKRVAHRIAMLLASNAKRGRLQG